MANYGGEFHGENLGGGNTYRERELKNFSEKENKRRGPIDLPFLVLTIIILTIGVIMVLSAMKK